MERPSHIIFDTQSHYFSHRLPLIGAAIALQTAVFWLFAHGLTGQAIRDAIHIIDVVPVDQKTMPPIAPPKPKIPTRVDVPRVSPPVIDVDPAQGRNTITSTSTPTVNPVQPAAEDRAPVSIIATHTVPPYPPIARRIGAEGKVTLRLTVSAEGRVSRADVVTSSGRDDLDQTARQWIMAHWTYKPALDNGVPAVSHTLATVTFSLTNEH